MAVRMPSPPESSTIATKTTTRISGEEGLAQ
jgi:hypothetical protein